MSEWIVVPFRGLGELRFGMSRSDVRALLGTQFRRVREGQPGDMEVYDALGVHVHYDYDGDDKVHFIEVRSPCMPTYDGIALLQNDTKPVLRQLAERGHTTEYDNAGYDFAELGFVLYVPYDSVEAVAVYREGYYDS